MSIANEVERLINAKADIKASLIAKGVEVSESDTLDTYAGKIDSIQTGDSYYEEFWDVYQQNGERTDYKYAFSCTGFTKENFKPKYPIRPKNANNMFFSSTLTDLDGIDIDFSDSMDCGSAFNNSSFVRLGVINASKIPSYSEWHLASIFKDAKNLETVDKFIVPSDFNNASNSWFTNCNSLKNIIFEGRICRDLSIVSSPLTAESAKSFIACLENYTGTAQEYVYSITFSPLTWGYLDSEGDTASPNSNSWREYINDLGWNAS